jgi:hypothetical protein
VNFGKISPEIGVGQDHAGLVLHDLSRRVYVLKANRKRSTHVKLAFLFMAILSACAGPASAGLQVGDPAPDFTLPAAAGGEVALSSYHGQPMLLYFHMAVG